MLLPIFQRNPSVTVYICMYCYKTNHHDPAYKHSLKELVGCGYGQNEPALYEILDSLKHNSIL